MEFCAGVFGMWEGEEMLIGIDPGCSGALVALHDGEPVEWSLMPSVKVGSATRVNAAALSRWLEDRCAFGHVAVIVEQVAARPGQGVSSMFNFGHATGTVMGVIGSLALPCSLVTPRAWKKRAGLIGQDKDAARSRAIQLWPQWRALDLKGKGQALADAALIARYGA